MTGRVGELEGVVDELGESTDALAREFAAVRRRLTALEAALDIETAGPTPRAGRSGEPPAGATQEAVDRALEDVDAESEDILEA